MIALLELLLASLELAVVVVAGAAPRALDDFGPIEGELG
jgi:hypothetical protein